VASLLAFVAGCSSGPTDVVGAPVNCGAGTTLSGSDCVAADGGLEDATSGFDAHAADGATTADATTADVTLQDGSADARPPEDASNADGSGEAGEPPPDPCPEQTPPPVDVGYIDCDSTCCAANADCDGNVPEATYCTDSTCSTGPFMVRDQGVDSFIVRTPDHPGSNATCATRCPGSGFAYGVGVTLDPTHVTPVQVTVGPPWEIVGYSTTPYCPDSNSTVATTGCLFLNALAGGSIYIMTKDPNAPARNVTFTLANPQQCPTNADQ
jgi:hypothetical protein